MGNKLFATTASFSSYYNSQNTTIVMTHQQLTGDMTAN